MNPCGLVMDWLRSAYSTTMRFRDGDDPIAVRWYRADEGANAFPAFHAFQSQNWDDRQPTATGLGEQPGPRPWRSGVKPGNGYIGDDLSAGCAAAIPDWWENGIPEGEDFGPYDEDGVPICCTGCEACSGMEMPAELAMVVAPASGECPCWGASGAITMTYNAAICKYTGSLSACGYVMDITATPPAIDGGQWSIAVEWGPWSASGLGTAGTCDPPYSEWVLTGPASIPCTSSTFSFFLLV